MIGEALEITIVVSMLVLVGYPSTLMALEALRARRKRASARVPGHAAPVAPLGLMSRLPWGRRPEFGKVLLTLTTR